MVVGYADEEQMAQKATPEGLTGELGTLADVLSSLDQAIGLLGERLEPILAPRPIDGVDPPGPADRAIVPERPRAELVSVVRGLQAHARILAGAVRSICDRVEL